MTELTTSPATDINWWPAKVCSEAYFRRVIAAAATAYVALRRDSLPDVKTIAKYMSANNKTPQTAKIARVIATPEFRKAMQNRGVNWSSKSAGITPEQSFALSILTDPTAGSFQVRLRKAGITYTKWQAWLRQPLFSQAFTAITEGSLKDNVGAVHTALVKKATDGDVRAMEFFYQISGRFDPAREQNMNMQAIILQLIEVLTKRLGNQPELLEVIGADIESILEQGNSKAITAVIEPEPEDYEGIEPPVVQFELPLSATKSVFGGI